jgi:hypothetical protein
MAAALWLVNINSLCRNPGISRSIGKATSLIFKVFLGLEKYLISFGSGRVFDDNFV